MKMGNVAVILLPTVVMVVISILSFTGVLSLLDAKGLIIVGLLLIFPSSFLLQGILCVVTKTNILASLIVSTLAYIVIMFIFLNSSAFGYIFMYAIAFGIGYLATRAFWKG